MRACSSYRNCRLIVSLAAAGSFAAKWTTRIEEEWIYARMTNLRNL